MDGTVSTVVRPPVVLGTTDVKANQFKVGSIASNVNGKFIKNDNTLWVAGDNSFGQLGGDTGWWSRLGQHRRSKWTFAG
jgi:hypothetical protein